jgi:PKD repeat protein
MKKLILQQLIWLMGLSLALPGYSVAQGITNEDFIPKQILDNDLAKEEKIVHNTNDAAMWLHWDDGENENQWGFPLVAENFDLVSKWDPSDITNYDGWKITKMRFIINSPTPILTLKIWEGPATTEVYSQGIGTFTAGDWTVIVLDTAQTIDASTELWAGLNINMQYPDMNVVSTDNGPPVDEYGNLYRLDGSWYSDYDNQNLQIWIEPILTADFEADTTTFCGGTTVNYSDSSLLATSWDWTFEGGIPATSTDQNPSVLYNTPGDYDATLIVSDGTDFDTLVKTDYISVLETPAQADEPEGDSAVCTDGSYTYTTDSVQYASDYEWGLDPSDAGVLTPNGTSATLQTDPTWTGDFSLKVRATNMCGDGDWSDDFEGTVVATPAVFTLSDGGEYCDGESGVEITQDGSEVDVDYELFFEGTTTGTIIAGTGSEISYGFFTDEGSYSATASNGTCDEEMNGLATIIITYIPDAASTPIGDTSVCAGTTTDYTVMPIEGADSILWSLDPPEAGTITGSDQDISIEWDADFEGMANLTAQGKNECGLGDESDALEITCSQTPAPEIEGSDVVCKEEEAAYSTAENEDNTYEWTVTGGEIITGEGTNQITVLWGDPGSGTVDLTETAGGTCEGIAETLDVTIDECTGFEDLTEAGIKVYPNPAHDYLIIQSENLISMVKLYDVTGREMANEKVNGNNYQLNTSKFKPGVYWLLIEGSDARTGKRIVLE